MLGMDIPLGGTLLDMSELVAGNAVLSEEKLSHRFNDLVDMEALLSSLHDSLGHGRKKDNRAGATQKSKC